MTILKPQPLTAEAFAKFGDVIEVNDQTPVMINEGLTQRFHDLSPVDTAVQDGHTLINIFRTTPKELPIKVEGMERHPLASQAFVPMSRVPFLVLVASKELSTLAVDDLTLFITNGRQGVNYHRNVWHHYSLALEKESDFLVVDRGGEGDNLEEFFFPKDVTIEIQL